LIDYHAGDVSNVALGSLANSMEQSVSNISGLQAGNIIRFDVTKRSLKGDIPIAAMLKEIDVILNPFAHYALHNRPHEMQD
jgi:hypothetical protein